MVTGSLAFVPHKSKTSAARQGCLSIAFHSYRVSEHSIWSHRPAHSCFDLPFQGIFFVTSDIQWEASRDRLRDSDSSQLRAGFDFRHTANRFHQAAHSCVTPVSAVLPEDISVLPVFRPRTSSIRALW